MDDDDVLMTLAQVAEKLSMSPDYIRRTLLSTAGGDLPAMKIGRHYRIRKSDLIRYLEARYKISGTRPANV